MWELRSKMSGHKDRSTNVQIRKHPYSHYTTFQAPHLQHIIVYFSWFAKTSGQIWQGFSDTGSGHVPAHSLAACHCWLSSDLSVLFVHLHRMATVKSLYTRAGRSLAIVFTLQS